MLQCVAVCRSVSQYLSDNVVLDEAVKGSVEWMLHVAVVAVECMIYVAVCYSVLQSGAVYCSVLQCVAVYRSVVQQVRGCLSTLVTPCFWTGPKSE